MPVWVTWLMGGVIDTGGIARAAANGYVSAAEAGLGIAQMPAFVVKEAMERGALDLVLADWPAEPYPL